MEVELLLLEGGIKLVIVVGQLIDLGEELCMLFMFVDFELCCKVEILLWYSEEWFIKMFRCVFVVMVIGEVDGYLFCDINVVFMCLMGYVLEEIIGCKFGDVWLWESDEVCYEIEVRLEVGGVFENFEIWVVIKDGGVFDVVILIEVIYFVEVECVLWVFQDIIVCKYFEIDLVEVIEVVMKDMIWFSCLIMEKFVNFCLFYCVEVLVDLDDFIWCECEVFVLICCGFDDKLIVCEFDVLGNIVCNYVVWIYGKIGVNCCNVVVVWVWEWGFDGDFVMICV